MDKQTSDERLLKIIEGTGESRKAQANVPGLKRPLVQAVMLKFNLAALKNVFKDVKISLAKINKALIGLGVFLTLIFIYILLSAPTISKSNAAYFNPSDSAAIAKFISAGEEQGLMRKNISSEGLRRNFFLPENLRAGSVTTQDGNEVMVEIKDLKLVGIIWSQNPEVMIENAKDSRTYILKQGELFNEQFKIKEILRNSVILEVNLGSGVREYQLR